MEEGPGEGAKGTEALRTEKARETNTTEDLRVSILKDKSTRDERTTRLAKVPFAFEVRSRSLRQPCSPSASRKAMAALPTTTFAGFYRAGSVVFEEVHDQKRAVAASTAWLA